MGGDHLPHRREKRLFLQLRFDALVHRVDRHDDAACFFFEQGGFAAVHIFDLNPAETETSLQQFPKQAAEPGSNVIGAECRRFGCGAGPERKNAIERCGIEAAFRRIVCTDNATKFQAACQPLAVGIAEKMNLCLHDFLLSGG